jgi:hypothetical protein
MTIEQTVEIDQDRRVLRLDQPLPETVGAGRTKLTLIFSDDTENAPGIRAPEQAERDRNTLMEIIHDYYKNASGNNGVQEPTWGELHAEARAQAQYYKEHPRVSLRPEGLEKRSREQIIEDAIAEVQVLRDEWDD